MEIGLNDALVVIGDLELVRRKLTARVEQLEAMLADPAALRAHVEQLAASVDELETLDATRAASSGSSVNV